MPNAFITSSVIAKRGIATLYNSMVLAALVWRDFDGEFTGKHGDTVTIRKPAVFTAEEFDRSTGVTLQDITEDSVDVTLDTIANVSFPVTDEEMTLEISDFDAQLLTPASEAIVQKVDGDLAETAADAARTANQIAVQGAEEANFVFRKAREIVSRNRMPVTDRFAVLSPEGVTETLGDDLLIAADKSGATTALREAIIGRLLGFDTYESQVLGEGPGTRGEVDGVALHKSAVTLAVRPLQAPKGVGDGQVAVEDYRGLSLRVVYAYNNRLKQDEVSVDLLYGIAVTRPEGAVELDFGQGS